ncbi:hypothetical protein CR513_53645, partial [Mucuna pruriens]
MLDHIFPLTLHVQLGYTGLLKLPKLVPKLFKLSSLHVNRENILVLHFSNASSPFALVHYDVWGPSDIVTPCGSAYFVTFINVLYMQFYHEIKTQFTVPIRSLHRDNVNICPINFSNLWCPKASFTT